LAVFCAAIARRLCSSRLKLEVKNSLFVNDAALKITGALGVIKNKENVEVIYGPATSDIKTRLEEFLKANKKKRNFPSLAFILNICTQAV